MNKNVLLIMGGAVLVAIVVALIVQAKLAPSTQGGVAASNKILVANKRLLTGEKLNDKDVRFQSWPDSAMFMGVITQKDIDEKKVSPYTTPLRRNIESGEPVTTQALIPDAKGGNNFLAALVSPGMRAVSIPASISNSVGGFLMPGDRVDIILSYSVSVPSEAKKFADTLVDRYASQTVMHNVKILAVDQNNKEPDKSAAKSSLKTVTIEVTQEGAEVIALVKQMGTISLSLRRIGELDTPDSTVTPITTDAKTSEVAMKINEIVEKAKSNAAVRIYSGNSVTNIPVRSVQEE
jgi:pilus assembly protein CpaB